MSFWRRRPRTDGYTTHPLVRGQQVQTRMAIEAQLLALGVPPDRSVEEARLILERHLETSLEESGIVEVHDDIVRTAGTVAS